MPNMHAKFRVTEVKPGGENYESVSFASVTDSKYGPNGENEDNEFARWTPSGHCSLSITNPALVGKFKVDEKYYVDFTLADK